MKWSSGHTQDRDRERLFFLTKIHIICHCLKILYIKCEGVFVQSISIFPYITTTTSFLWKLYFYEIISYLLQTTVCRPELGPKRRGRNGPWNLIFSLSSSPAPDGALNELRIERSLLLGRLGEAVANIWQTGNRSLPPVIRILGHHTVEFDGTWEKREFRLFLDVLTCYCIYWTRNQEGVAEW